MSKKNSLSTKIEIYDDKELSQYPYCVIPKNYFSRHRSQGEKISKRPPVFSVIAPDGREVVGIIARNFNAN